MDRLPRKRWMRREFPIDREALARLVARLCLHELGVVLADAPGTIAIFVGAPTRQANREICTIFVGARP